MHAAAMPRYLPPGARRAALRAGGGAVPIRRRGVLHGWAVEDGSDRPAPAAGGERRRRWAAARPIVLRGVLAAALSGRRAALARTRAAFDRFRAGARFQDWVGRRLAGQRRFVLAGATVDLGDPRELEKVFVHERRGGRVVARDLFAKLSWIAHDARDVSLRIRFSHGHEVLNEWWRDPRRSRAGDRLAAALFPECTALDQPALRRLVARLTGGAVRFSERIVYNNAPDGGAVFHHDAEPTQRGVLFGQLQGATFWLALPRRELARAVAAARGLPFRAALRALDDTTVPWLHRLLNERPAFTARLLAAGAGFTLRAGDAVLLPNHGPAATCWHSVFALGDAPSLALSFGVFARAPAPAAARNRRKLAGRHAAAAT
jgi:hypothetical protein